MTSRIGFLINPIAGMGGRVGLKGTDNVVRAAIELGAHPTSHLKADETLRKLKELLEISGGDVGIDWLTCSGRMGAEALRAAGFVDFEVVYKPSGETSDADTKAAVRRLLDLGVELVLFCGGDGTARDIVSVVAQRIPILGIPSGVKMFSGVFGISPARTAEILIAFLEGRLEATPVDVLDLDEDKYRQGEWDVRLYYSALTPYESTLTQSAKMLFTEATEAEVKGEIANYLLEEMEASPDELFLLGPGSTVQSIGHALGIDKTLLGVDAVVDGQIVGKDLNERGIMELFERFPRRSLVVSPIGAQGFVLGRGNQQLSPEVIRKIDDRNIIVVATPAKLARTPVLRFDTGDAALDAALANTGYVPVVVGYRRRRLAKVDV
jgi:predicted polyphosphate/ATP-dependent NAD kinase